jgi:hypothetical protein
MRITLAPGIYQDDHGITVRVKVGTGAAQRTDEARYPLGTAIKIMKAWQVQARAKLERLPVSSISRGTFDADVIEYLRIAPITPTTRKVRTQQLKWWGQQPVEIGSRRTLGELRRGELDPKRIREILWESFKPTDPANDPTEFASTSNSYRTALNHLFSVLDADDPFAMNPVRKVAVRAQAAARPRGQDARIVREILKQVPSKFGRKSGRSALRLHVLAWVHITPTQLMQVNPPSDFHDRPDASRSDIVAGSITLTKHARLKGRQKLIPPPETIPLNPWGVDALRAFTADPDAWGKFSMSPLNKVFKRACTRAQSVLAKRGVIVDLSEMTMYHLKHSLATTASIAAAGLVDAKGKLRQDPGVQRALDHADPGITSIYTAASVDPLVRRVNAATSVYLDHLFKTPLAPAAPLRRVR